MTRETQRETRETQRETRETQRETQSATRALPTLRVAMRYYGDCANMRT